MSVVWMDANEATIETLRRLGYFLTYHFPEPFIRVYLLTRKAESRPYYYQVAGYRLISLDNLLEIQLLPRDSAVLNTYLMEIFKNGD